MFIKDGNFAPWVRFSFCVIGIVIGIAAFYTRSLFLLTVGLVIAVMGGYSSKAHMLGIKPFDNSYKKARESYKNSEEKKEGEE